jgi:hypothetical protein
MKQPLTEQDFINASKTSKLSVAEIKTVSEVESRGKAFYADGFPVILFERHKFSKFTKGKFDKSHPEISNPKAGGYGAAGDNQRRKFNIAFGLNAEAAMMSCSWGRFQIMGFNFAMCGFLSVGAFVDAMKESEVRQLDLFLEYVRAAGLKDELQRHDWVNFARLYNGADYKKNNYDVKLKNAYDKFK